MKTLAEQIGDLVALSLSCPTMGFGGGSVLEERMQDRWAWQVHAEAERLHRLVLGQSPEAVRIIELVQAETYRPGSRPPMWIEWDAVERAGAA